MIISLPLCLFLQVTFLRFFLSFISTILPASFWSFTTYIFSPGTMISLYMHFNWMNSLPSQTSALTSDMANNRGSFVIDF